jgi:hypothetical protein
MKQNILVVFARGYRIENADKSINEGVTINYLLTDNLSPVGDKVEKGIRFSKGSLPIDKAKSVNKVPGLYEADFTVRTDAKGSVTLKLADIDFISEIKVDYPDIEKQKTS